jgi:predicted RNA-binding protein with PIN domain
LPYQVVSIGRVFNDKTRAQLIQRMNEYESQGWKFHSVFAVGEQAGCLGQNTTETLYMVMESKN